MGPQFLYVDEDWANSSLRRKLFGRPQHQEKSVTEKDRVKEVCECITLSEVLFIPFEMGATTHHMDIMPALHRQTDAQCCVALTCMVFPNVK